MWLNYWIGWRSGVGLFGMYCVTFDTVCFLCEFYIYISCSLNWRSKELYSPHEYWISEMLLLIWRGKLWRGESTLLEWFVSRLSSEVLTFRQESWWPRMNKVLSSILLFFEMFVKRENMCQILSCDRDPMKKCKDHALQTWKRTGISE